MTVLDKTEALKDALFNDKITYEDFVTKLKKIQATCKHERKEVYMDDNDYYVTCKDCGEEL